MRTFGQNGYVQAFLPVITFGKCGVKTAVFCLRIPIRLQNELGQARGLLVAADRNQQSHGNKAKRCVARC